MIGQAGTLFTHQVLNVYSRHKQGKTCCLGLRSIQSVNEMETVPISEVLLRDLHKCPHLRGVPGLDNSLPVTRQVLS